MFRNLINFLITGLIFWVGMTYFPEYVHIQDIKTLFLATIFMFVIGYVVQWLTMISFGLIAVGIGCITSIIMMGINIFIIPFKLWILTKYLPGFEVHGFWTYLVITVILMMFSVKARRQQTTTTTTQK
ncbi:Membrane protein of unknown function [compost metagenome]